MVRKAVSEDVRTVALLSTRLWPENAVAEMEKEFSLLLDRKDAAVFLATDGEASTGFAQCGLRRDYVEGATSSPVGYLEGIFVAESHRHRGYARELLSACENWAREMGCREFASDCELTNAESLRFHLGVGFQEANRIICFTKEL